MAWGGDPGWTYSLESQATPNPAHGGTGPGSQTSRNINVNSGADPCLTLDPSLMNSSGVSAQQIVAQALSQGTLDWGYVARTALAAVAVLLALMKYARAFGDPPLDTSLEGAGDVTPGGVVEPGQSDLAGDGASG